MRDESCGCHFREEHQTEDGECQRNDEQYAYVAAWEFTGVGKTPTLHKEPLVTRKCIWRRGATSNERQTASVAAERPAQRRRFIGYEAKDINPNMSFLEMLDVVNEDLTNAARNPSRSTTIAARVFVHVFLCINGEPHGRSTRSPPADLYAQLLRRRNHHRRALRAKAFPLIKDLVVDRTRSTGSSRREVFFPSRPAPHRRQCDSRAETGC